MDFNKSKEHKIKMVHFMNEAALANSKNKNQKNQNSSKHKSNLKKTKSKRGLNLTNTIETNASELNTTKNYLTSRKQSPNKAETEASTRNKANPANRRDLLLYRDFARTEAAMVVGVINDAKLTRGDTMDFFFRVDNELI